jgi:hypothetical protein
MANKWTKQETSVKQVLLPAHSSTIKMEATCSLKTLADFQRPTGRYVPEDITLCNHRLQTWMLLVMSMSNAFIKKYPW